MKRQVPTLAELPKAVGEALTALADDAKSGPFGRKSLSQLVADHLPVFAELRRLGAVFFEAAGFPRHTVRIESVRRRGEFADDDSLINLEAVDDSVTEFGGKARLFKDAYGHIKIAIERQEVVITDCGPADKIT